MISSSVGSGHPGKYSYEIPHEYLKGLGNLSGEIISAKRNHQSNLVSFFFQIAISPLEYVVTFSGQHYLGKVTSSQFFRVTTLTQQLLFRDSYFFRTAAFFHFFRTVTFLQEFFPQNSFFFGAKRLQSRHFLRIRSSLRQLLFRITILSGGTVQDKDI